MINECVMIVSRLFECCLMYEACTKYYDGSRFPKCASVGYLFSIGTAAAMVLAEQCEQYSLLACGVAFLLLTLYEIVLLRGKICGKPFFAIFLCGMLYLVRHVVGKIVADLSVYLIDVHGALIDGLDIGTHLLTCIAFSYCICACMLLLDQKIELWKKLWFRACVVSIGGLYIWLGILALREGNADSFLLIYLLPGIGVLLVGSAMLAILQKITDRQKMTFQISLLQTQLTQQKKAIEDMDALYHAYRQANHDNMNHFLAVQEMLHEKRIEEAEQYVAELTNRNPQTSVTCIQVPDHYMRAVLQVKYAQCKQMQIPFQIRSDDTEPLCDKLDICVILSNLLDNAIEASTKTEDPGIELYLSRQRGYYVMELRNRIQGSVLQGNATLQTTKPDKVNHGIGMQSVQKIVETHDGMMEYYEQDHWFVVQVWLPQVGEKSTDDRE